MRKHGGGGWRDRGDEEWILAELPESGWKDRPTSQLGCGPCEPALFPVYPSLTGSSSEASPEASGTSFCSAWGTLNPGVVLTWSWEFVRGSASVLNFSVNSSGICRHPEVCKEI